jgi:hypothetical protein
MYLESVREMSDLEREVLCERLSAASPGSGRSRAKRSFAWVAGFVLVVLRGAGLLALKPNPAAAGLAIGVCTCSCHMGLMP